MCFSPNERGNAMNRLALFVVLSTQAAAALAAGGPCSVAGTAYDAAGRPMRDAVVRLLDLDTHQASFVAVDTSAMFTFDGVPDAGRYRLDVLSMPTIVTGTKIPSRSILGMSPSFGCSGTAMRQDVRAQIY